MGWNTDEGYYEKHVHHKGYKITELQNKMNKLKPDEVREGISAISTDKSKEAQIPENDLIETRDEPIEYVIETEDEDKGIDEEELDR